MRRLVFAAHLGQVFDKADHHDDQRANEADEEQPVGDAHGGFGQRDHRGIVMQRAAGSG